MLSDLLPFLLINYFQIKTVRSQVTEVAMATHACNPTKWEAEAGRSLASMVFIVSSRPNRGTEKTLT